MSISWNLPQGFTPRDVDQSMGFSEEPEYDDYCNGCDEADLTPMDYQSWAYCGRPSAPDPTEIDGEYAEYCDACEVRDIDPCSYTAWLDGVDQVEEHEDNKAQARGDWEYHNAQDARLELE